MGTLIRIDLDCAEPRCGPAFDAAAQMLVDVDQKMSTYHPSELTRISDAAGGQNYMQPVSADTAIVLSGALEIAQKSEGFFDPTIAPLIDAYKLEEKNFGRETAVNSEAISNAHELVSYRRLRLNGVKAGLRKPGMRLDLGAIAKGYALDAIALRLRKAGINTFSLNFGGHLLTSGVEMTAAIYDPRAENRQLYTCKLRQGSLSVSAQNQRYVKKGTAKIGHLINPITGQAEEKTQLSIVYDKSAMSADAWSTALFFADAERFATWTAKYHLTAYQLTATGAFRESKLAISSICKANGAEQSHKLSP